MKQEVIAGMILCAMGLAMLLVFLRRMAESCGKAENEGQERPRLKLYCFLRVPGVVFFRSRNLSSL